MTQAFQLAPQIEAGSLPVADFELCTIRLNNDARWPWLLLMPRVAGAEELFDLTPSQQELAMREASLVGEKLQAMTSCTKINIAMIGNMVRQLHIHVIARVEGDANWPGPVWGYGDATPYEDAHAAALIAHLRNIL